jgi:malonate-semialdehyde dehydrogenase (acetylating)/methylmalonate-semialdehyde dehydrogenase
MTQQTVGHWIADKHVASNSGRTAPVYDPALGVVTKQVALANAAEINAAIAAAKEAFTTWKDVPQAKRQQIMFKFRELLNERKGELAEIITSEHGKVLSDALGEITRGQEVVEFACGMPHLLKGFYTENASTGVDVYSTRQPLGVVGIISPFNFPQSRPATPWCSSRAKKTRAQPSGWQSFGVTQDCHPGYSMF